ncbi:hypothetical protein PIB30_096830 [Stylosanthes scabra]|uniref:DUF4219 domain-containing protein n=1 Tax=Stylosanthes scabra TaxID=79078 RepID=A0ABU6RW32_9FABA|nr:hypothetical protein [Stylosanthes scabra]
MDGPSTSYNIYASEGYSTTCPPLFDDTNYSHWKNKMRIWICAQDIRIWKIVEEGDQIPINNSKNDSSTDSDDDEVANIWLMANDEKEIDQRNNTIQQLEAALRELLERQTREVELASEAVRRAEELARKQQAILDEAEKRERDRLEKLEKLNSKTQTAAARRRNQRIARNSDTP